MTNTANAVLNEAQKHVGVSGRPNTFTRSYASRHGNVFLRAAWCDMFVTYCARISGARAAIPGGDRAYTVYHAQDFNRIERWFAGTTANLRMHAKPGDVVFFDWNGSNDISDIDHIGYVKKNLGDGRLITIEGNTGDACRLRVRGADVISGFGSCKYDKAPAPVSIKPIRKYPYKAGTVMQKGWENSKGVILVQGTLNARGYSPKLIKDGDFGEKTRLAVVWFQRRNGLAPDGRVGPKTWAKLFPAIA